jgi:hypothetical protein
MSNERTNDGTHGENSAQATSLYVPLVVFMLVSSVTAAGWYVSENERRDLRAEISALKNALADGRHEVDERAKGVDQKMSPMPED